MITKSNNLSLKNFDNKQGLVEFYFASFNTKDSDNDIILPGAYKKTLEENKARIKHLKNHDTTLAPGVVKDFFTDDLGVIVKSQLLTTTLGVDTLKEYEGGQITEHSQGFQIIDEEFSEQDGAFIIKEIKLWEVSTLNAWGANSNTPVVGIKSERMLSLEMNRLKRKAQHFASKGNDQDLLKLQASHKELLALMKALNLDGPAAATQREEPQDSSAEAFLKSLKL